VIGDAGCRCVHSMSNACGHGGSDTLCMHMARWEGIEVLEAWILLLYQMWQ
jgi:hypothetical protein